MSHTFVFFIMQILVKCPMENGTCLSRVHGSCITLRAYRNPSVLGVCCVCVCPLRRCVCVCPCVRLQFSEVLHLLLVATKLVEKTWCLQERNKDEARSAELAIRIMRMN